MSWTVTGTEKQPVDRAGFGSVSLLLHGEGSTIIDSSRYANTISVSGNTQISSTEKAIGNSSIYFDGSGDFLQFSSNPELFRFGVGDFTVEMFVRMTNNGTTFKTVIDFRAFNNELNSISIAQNNTAANFTLNAGGTNRTTSGFAFDTWYHLAISRSSGQTRCFANGTQLGTAIADATNYISVTNLRVGCNVLNGNNFFGYIDELRITKGIARYTANFTPPTAPFSDI